MEFETLKKDNRKKYIIGAIAILAIASVVFFVSTRANYKVTSRLNLINTIVNWNPTDLEIVSIKIKDGSNYTDAETVPASGYQLSNESYCEVNGSKNTNIPMEYKDGKVTIGVSQKGTKCYLIFEIKAYTISEIVNSLNKTTRTSFSSVLTENTTGTIYTAVDNDGTSYYYVGAVDNNWVYFGGFYWRIIRINGDGTIRIIYNGTTTSQTGTSTQIGTSAFNTNVNDNAYVGYMYGSTVTNSYVQKPWATGENLSASGVDWYFSSTYTFNTSTGEFTLGAKASNGASPYQYVGYFTCKSTSNSCTKLYKIGDAIDSARTVSTTYSTGESITNDSYTHTNTKNSTIKSIVDSWYAANLNKVGIKEHIDINAGFCGDRSLQSGTGVGTAITYYKAYNRLNTSKAPSLKCTNTNDLYTVSNANKGNKALTYPVGLITAEEVAYAGGLAGSSNSSYYLNTNQSYLTMTPSDFSGSRAREFYVYDDGNLSYDGVHYTWGVRPVINLKADTLFSGAGTTTNPYVVAN